ncbi:ATP-binding protein [Neisseriaceae bacterium TC5R-5]|nr:ATP-binding protein [Neisseriaceae bacterium TC5R-5]
MLIEFSATNWRSFKDTQTLSLVAAKGTELPENTFQSSAAATPRLLRSAVIYGPNASGKSNLLKALTAMKNIVLESTTYQHDAPIPVTPFLLASEMANQATTFEITFVAENVRYQYGFSATSERIDEEWLFAYPNGRAQKWLERRWIAETGLYQWEKCHALTGQKQLWQSSTRPNALFLSTAVQLNSQQLQAVYDWFQKTLRMMGVAGRSPELTARLCDKDQGKKEQLLAFLKVADLGVHDLAVEARKLSAQDLFLPENMSEEMKIEILNRFSDKKVFDIQIKHQTSDRSLISFDIKEESDGTQKLFSFGGPWLDVLENGNVLVIDELNNSLHRDITAYLISLFHNPKTNPKNAQLIFTTHETSVLTQDIFRRDQVWFCEKNKEQATVLYPLTDFHPIKNRENLEANYLAGRYGALPFIDTTTFKLNS